MNAALIDEIITLKTVSRLSPAEIARRCGVQIADVGDVLIDAGLLVVRTAAVPQPWRNSLAAAHERLEHRIAPPAPSGPAIIDSPDLRHCLRVVRALGGRGFPFLTFDGASRV